MKKVLLQQNRRRGPNLSLGKMEMLAKYPQIFKIKYLGRKECVTTSSKVYVKCIDCSHKFWAKCETFLRHPNECRCLISCYQRHGRKSHLVYPKDLIDVSIADEKTLGKIGQVTEHTRIQLSCVNCGDFTKTRYGSYRKGVRLCIDCGRSRPKPRSKSIRLNSAKKMREHWKDPEYKKRVLEKIRKSLNGHTGMMSGPHRKLKQMMLESGYDSFESEQWITNKIRVDEVDLAKKIIIEMFGDYYHANPKLYKADTLIRLGLDKNWRASDIWERDKARIRELKRLGYSVIVIWEGELMKSGAKILSKVTHLFSASSNRDISRTTASVG